MDELEPDGEPELPEEPELPPEDPDPVDPEPDEPELVEPEADGLDPPELLGLDDRSPDPLMPPDEVPDWLPRLLKDDDSSRLEDDDSSPRETRRLFCTSETPVASIMSSI